MHIAMIGGGNMASALIGGLRTAQSTAQITVIDPHEDARHKARSTFQCQAYARLQDVPTPQFDLVVLAVKPQSLRQVCGEIAQYLGDALVVSIVAGIRSDAIQAWLGGPIRLVRTMPNTPALIREGMTGLFATPNCSAVDRRQAEALMQAVGVAVWVDEESQLDGITALSGSGPAYFFLLMESMIAAAQSVGIDAKTAQQLVVQTAVGAARLAASSAHDPATLRAQVTSKGGTTAAALDAFAQGELPSLVQKAVQAAQRRSIELGDLLSQA